MRLRKQILYSGKSEDAAKLCISECSQAPVIPRAIGATRNPTFLGRHFKFCRSTIEQTILTKTCVLYLFFLMQSYMSYNQKQNPSAETLSTLFLLSSPSDTCAHVSVRTHFCRVKELHTQSLLQTLSLTRVWLSPRRGLIAVLLWILF